MASEEFRHESLQDLDAVIEYLGELRDGFGKGQITLGSNHHSIVIDPEGLIKTDVKARQQGTQVRLNIKLTWENSTEVQTPESSNVIQSNSRDENNPVSREISPA